MRRTVVVWVVAATVLTACGTDAGVRTLRAEPSYGLAEQQADVLDAAPCIFEGSTRVADLAERTADWTRVVDCTSPHRLQVVGRIPAPDRLSYEDFLDQDRLSDTVAEQIGVDCARVYERTLGLDGLAGMAGVDDDVLVTSARGPELGPHAPVPREMWEDGHRELVCYVWSPIRITYDVTDLVRPGATVPLDVRWCWRDYRVPCSEPHDSEQMLDVDVTDIVANGWMEAELPPVDTDEWYRFLEGTDAVCEAAAIHLGVALDMYVGSWTDASEFPDHEGGYGVRCYAYGIDRATTGSVFD